jgi:hypothetical protein
MIASRDGHQSDNGPNRRKVSRAPSEIASCDRGAGRRDEARRIKDLQGAAYAP